MNKKLTIKIDYVSRKDKDIDVYYIIVRKLYR